MAQMRPNRPIRLFVYYGMFDCKMRQEGNIFLSDWEGKFVPLIRMDDATDIMQWTNAVAEFYSNGSVTQMKRLLGKGKG